MACLAVPSGQLRAQAAPDYDMLAAEATRLLSTYLQVNTVSPPGNELAGALWLQQVLRREGIESEVFESAPGRGNLYARLKGTGAKRPLVLLSHIDVVPFTAERWQVDPMSGAIKDGYVWGRGALDMKGTAIIEVVTMIALKRRGVPLSRDIILVANADEETASSGARWFAQEKADLLAGSEFLINEGGANRVGESGAVEYYGIAVTEKVPYWLRLTARGTPGHGSRPTPDNPVSRLARAVARVAAWETPLTLTPPVERFLKDLATVEPDSTLRLLLADPAAALADPDGAARLTANLNLNALLRNTISPTVLQGSNKTNVIPPEAIAELDVRLLPGTRPADFVAQLKRVIDDSLVEVTPISQPREATSSPLSGELVESVKTTVEEMDPGVLVTTPMLAGYTDSYYYRNLGIGAYGLSPFRVSDAEGRGVHGNDERVSLENIRFGVEFFYRIVLRVAQ